MNKANIILVGGIHGVGKTKLCHFLSSTLNFEYLSASELIQTAQEKTLSTDKNVEDLQGNQKSLASALSVSTSPGHWYLLDGHFCLLNQKNQIVEVPLFIFKVVSPKMMLLLHDEISIIRQRLLSRDSKSYDFELLNVLQKKEIRYAKYLSQTLDIPLLITSPYTKNITKIHRYIKETYCHLEEVVSW